MYGTSLIKIHNGSLYSVFSTNFPDYDWLPWQFAKAPSQYWNNKENVLKFFSWVYKELKLTCFEDWYKVTFQVIKKWRENK